MSNTGLITVASPHTVAQTLDRVIAAIAPLGLVVFARIDHAQSAASVGLPLRPTQLLIFGNPKGGTPLMQDRQVAGIDLPLKCWPGRMPTERSGSPGTTRNGLRSVTVLARQARRRSPPSPPGCKRWPRQR
jgi:hypothetical protein